MYYMQPPMMLYEPKELRVLLLSDIHSHGANFNKLAEWLKAFKPNYDMVFVLGNISNMLNNLRNNPIAENQATEQLVSTFKFLKDYINNPIVYIPGNTEPTAIYSYALELPEAMNLHKRAMQIDDNLILIGLGGSLPAKKEEKDILEGYPYEKAEDYGKDLASCMDAAEKTFGPNVSYLLLTHIGPAESTTTEVYLNNDTVNGGFKEFAAILKEKNIVGHVHGHSVAGEGLSKPFGPSKPVINPGGFVNGRFGELSLRRDVTGKWKVADVQFRSLD